MGELSDAIYFITEFKAARPDADKEEIQDAYVRRFNPGRSRSLFLGGGYALRFSDVHGRAFSNTVLSLSALISVDHLPVVVCVVGPRAVRFLLANATLLRKVSHSSQQLRTDNVKGSFNGTDILTVYEGVPNEPNNFEELFAIHSAFTSAENLERLVEATNAIVGRDRRFYPTDAQREILLGAPARAAAAIASARFAELDEEFRAIVRARQPEILRVAALENVNLRGNRIEQIVTGAVNAHELGDVLRDLAAGQLAIDVKTKLLGRLSAPKAYNIDKMLAFHSVLGSVFAFLVLGVDLQDGAVAVRLVPVLDDVLLEATRVQHHWAGRISRGVAQLDSRYDRVLARDFRPRVDLEHATAFLLRLLGD